MRDQKFDPELEALLKEELNVKEVVYAEKTFLDTQITHDLLKEGYAREIMRQIQDMRKEAKYKLDELVWAAWDTGSPDIIEAINEHKKDIAKSTLLKEFDRGQNLKQVFDIEKEFELRPQAKVWLGIRTKK